MAIPTVLTISASDSSGTDGIQADLRTLAALKTHGASVVTVITAQNTQAVTAAEMVSEALVEAQLRAVFDDLALRAVKVGALGTAPMIETVATVLGEVCTVPIVGDAFMVTRGGDRMIDDDALAAFRTHLLPKLTVLVVNLEEAALLTDTQRATTLGEMLDQGNALVAAGAAHVLVSGGHGQAETCTDLLFAPGQDAIRMSVPRLERQNMRALSSTLSAGIAAHIAHEMSISESIQTTKVFVTGAIDAADTFAPGKGPNSIHQMHRLWEPRQAAIAE